MPKIGHLLVQREVGQARVVAHQGRALRVERHRVVKQGVQAARALREAAHAALEMRFGGKGRPVHCGVGHCKGLDRQAAKRCAMAALVAGKNRVPKPATGKTALRMLF